MTSIKQPNGKMAIKHLLAQCDQCCQRSCADISGTECVCTVWLNAHAVCVPVHIKSVQLLFFFFFFFMPPLKTQPLRCSKPLTLRLSVTDTSSLTHRGVHNAIY